MNTLIVLAGLALSGISLVLFLVAVFLIKKGWKYIKEASLKKREFAKYDFEHRSSGGAVEFPTFEDAEKDQLNRGRVQGDLFSGCLLIFVGVALVWMALLVVVVVLFYMVAS